MMEMDDRQGRIRFVYIAFALILLMASWESNRSMAAMLTADIPQDAIRIRILAHSDSVQDQWFKRILQQSIVDQVSEWAGEMGTIDEARVMIGAHMPELSQLTEDLLQEYRMGYGFTIELGQVPFPAKTFGNQVYPAGSYEALRITLGEGRGQNWWCVLFPPLCFVDVVAREPFFKKASAAKSEAEASAQGSSGVKQDKVAEASSADFGLAASSAAPVSAEASAKSAEVRFFIVDLAKETFAFVKKWFA